MPQIPIKTQRQAIEDHAPWKPASFEDADAAALQAVAHGMASPDQQKRAITWLIEKGAATYDMTYRPGALEGERDTSFAEGRRFVGLQVVKLLKWKTGIQRRPT